MEAIVTNARKM